MYAHSVAAEFIDCEGCSEELAEGQRVCPACGRDRHTGKMDAAWEAEALRRDPLLHERGRWDEIQRPLRVREIAWFGIGLGALVALAGTVQALVKATLEGLAFAAAGAICVWLGVERLSPRRRGKR